MSTWDPAEIVGRWTLPRITGTPAGAVPSSRTAFARTDGPALQMSASADVARTANPALLLPTASGALVEAFAAFTSHSRPILTASISTRAAISAGFTGTAARVEAIAASRSVLQTTETINTQTSTVRSSSSPVGLDVTDAASTIRSTAEMNTAAQALSSSSLALHNSTSRLEISGAYSGNATALTFEMTHAAPVTVGAAAKTVSFDVVDQNNTVVASYSGSTTAGQEIDLAAIGLKVRFTAGSLSGAGTGTVSVSQAPVNIDTAAAFNAAWGSAPQFENFGRVSAGAFTINGISIAVNADDSIDAVLTRINASAAGVTASVSGDRVVIASSSASESDISIGGDTSGFLVATKLSTAVTARGNLRDDQQLLSQVAAFAAVTTGSFTVNGVSIAIDPDADTLQDLLDRINGAGAGVTAAYDGATDRLTVTPDAAGATLSMAGDTSGFFAAAHVAEGTVGSAIDPDAAFDGSGGADPLFDPGLSVQAGTFTVNSVTITVAANDTLNAVGARISAAGAGVTAAFDAATQLVTLTAIDEGPDAIVLGGDTSGFLAAVKLDGSAQSTIGAEAVTPFDNAFSDFAEYAAVSAGTVTLNGEQIAIDPAVMTVEDLVASLDGITDIDATLDEATGRIRVSSAAADGSIVVTDTSGILAALGIAAGAYEGSPSATTVTETQTGTLLRSNSRDTAAAAARAAAEVSDVLTQLAKARPGDEDYLKALVAAVSDAAGSLREAGIGGLTVGGDEPDIRLVVDREALAAALDALANPADVAKTVADALSELALRIDAAVALPPPSTAPAGPVAISLPLLQLEADQGRGAGSLFLKALERLEVG